MLQYEIAPNSRGFTPNREGQWSIRDKRLATGATLGSWSVLAFGGKQELPIDAIKTFIRELINTCQQIGMVS